MGNKLYTEKYNVRQQGREEILTGKVICVPREDKTWDCKTREELEEQVKFLQKLQPKSTRGIL